MREIRLVRGVEKEAPEKEIEAPRGELKKQVSPAEKLDARMERVENRTNFLIEKAKKRKVKSAQVKNTSLHVETHQEQKGRQAKEPSLLEFYCLKGLPKIILRHIQEKVSFDSNFQNWISIIDTEDLKSLTKKTASHLSVQLLRLEKQGWFRILQSNNAGVRVIQIKPDAFPIKQ
jgi:hypothetical protein